MKAIKSYLKDSENTAVSFYFLVYCYLKQKCFHRMKKIEFIQHPLQCLNIQMILLRMKYFGNVVISVWINAAANLYSMIPQRAMRQVIRSSVVVMLIDG